MAGTRRMRVTVDATRGRAKTRAIRRAADANAREVSLVHARVLVNALDSLSPRDTRRYVRGWQMAGRDLGVWSSVDTVRRSERADLIASRLERQIERIEKAIDTLERDAEKKRELVDLWFTSRGRKLSPGARRMLRRAEKNYLEAARLKVVLGRAEDQLARFEASGGTAILIYASRSRRSRSSNQPVDGVKRRSRRRRIHTVRDQVYGGVGTMRSIGGGVVLTELHNKEAHASIVERRHSPLSRARAVASAKAVPMARRMAKTRLKRDMAAAGHPI